MKILSSVRDLSFLSGEIYLAMGTFDGMHLGHRKVISQMVKRAKEKKGIPVVFTFLQNPTYFLQKKNIQLSTSEQKISRLQKLGVEFVIMENFNASFSRISPLKFLSFFLKSHFSLKEVFVGENWRFGYQGEGDVTFLKFFAKAESFKVSSLPLLQKEGDFISSTRIRELISMGEFKRAEDYLGHPLLFCGRVLKGDTRGHCYGFPTINLNIKRVFLPRGVFSCQVRVQGKWYQGVSNYGTRPTFSQDSLVLEAHLLDFCENIYGEEIFMRFSSFLREEKRFSSPEQLYAQILEDIRLAKEKLENIKFPSCSEERVC